MDPTTDGSKGAEVGQFYDAISGVYDRMTDFERRFVAERPFFRLLVDRYGIKTALDAGAGTGFHSLLLSELGVSVTAVDLSEAMLKRLRDHARARNADVETVCTPFEHLPSEWNGRFDAVFCLGNSVAHLLSESELLGSFSRFRHVLAPGGVLFVQLLNYDRILRDRARIQNVREEGGTTFVRFYDFEGDRIRFNLLQLTRKEGGIRHSLESVLLRPWRGGELDRHLRQRGFARVQMAGGITMEPYSPDASRNLVLTAVADQNSNQQIEE